MMRRFMVCTTPTAAYGFALIATACATAASLLVPSFFAPNPYTLFYLAATITAWYGGRGAGLASIIGGAIAADYFLLPPRHHFGFNSTAALLHMLLFIAVACVITGLIATRRHGVLIRPVEDRPTTEERHERSTVERGLALRLLDLRTHLTVATLAAAQLRRRHVSTIAAARLCVYIIRAHAQMLDDIRALEAELGEDDQAGDQPP